MIESLTEVVRSLASLVGTLRRNERADALWFEKQWLRAQFEVAWEGVPLPGHPSVS